MKKKAFSSVQVVVVLKGAINESIILKKGCERCILGKIDFTTLLFYTMSLIDVTSVNADHVLLHWASDGGRHIPEPRSL